MRALLVYGDRQWEIKIGYDEAYASALPGTLVLLSQLIRGAENNRIAHLFLGVSEAWQDRFDPVVVHFETMRTYPPALWSAMAFASDTSAVLPRRLRSLWNSRRAPAVDAPSA
jgi:hypothetical protein